jgi:NAD-dependent deacetylase
MHGPDSASRQRALVLTGAGISAESGIPTFRGAGGYWRNLDPARLATAEAFNADPQLVWDWYRERRRMIRQAVPNSAHAAVTRLAQQIPEFLLVTQNVDDLHRRAEHGGRSMGDDAMVQIHGDIFVSRCESCADSRRDDEDEPGVPRCARCGARLRPGVVWFGEMLGPALIARVDRFVARGGCTTIVVGTTAQFGYIVDWARRASRGGTLIEINPDETPLSPLAQEVYREPAAAALPRVAALRFGWK